jgi:hypothetical protein
MQDPKRKKGPLLHSKSSSYQTHVEKAFLKDEVTFEISKKTSQSNGKGEGCYYRIVQEHFSEHTLVKRFDSSKVESPFLTPSILERNATAKKAAD